jgi:transposase
MAKCITYIGLDVHKDTIAVALAEASLRGEVRERGKIPNPPATLKALAVKLASTRRDLRFCYGADHAAAAFTGNLPAWGTIVP